MAVKAHGHLQTTDDVDFLITDESLRRIAEVVGPVGFERVNGKFRRFLDRNTGVTFDFVYSGMHSRGGRPGPIAFPHPDEVSELIDCRCVVNLPTLIELKLAAGRSKDFGDVIALIRVRGLSESFLGKLHSFVRGTFVECLEARRREDEDEARLDEAFEDLLRQAQDSRK